MNLRYGILFLTVNHRTDILDLSISQQVEGVFGGFFDLEFAHAVFHLYPVKNPDPVDIQAVNPISKPGNRVCLIIHIIHSATEIIDKTICLPAVLNRRR